MIDPLWIYLCTLANGTKSWLLVQSHGFGLYAADKKEHFFLSYHNWHQSHATCSISISA
jgi:hypothetical protein